VDPVGDAAGRRIVVVGSLNADLTVRTRQLPRPGETVTGSDLSTSPGGKSSNQAAAAALLGANVALVGRVGDDAHGAFLRDCANKAGVDTTHVTRLSEAATGTAVIAVDDAGENCIIVSPGANGHLTPDDVADAADVFSGGGVLCLCFEVPPATVRAAAERACAAGLRVVLNPSPFAEVDATLLGLTDVLVVNQHELAAMVGTPTTGLDDADWSRAADTLAGRGPGHVIVTLGAAGAAVLDLAAKSVVTTIPAPAVKAIDTTGCGDAFLGALAYRLALDDDPITASRYAVDVGAFAATRTGAQSSYPTSTELADFRRTASRP
jgi:ribokinase